MINFTLTKEKNLNSKINNKIKKDLEYISSKVKNLLGDKLHSILLCGGFGRGEGSVVVKKGIVHIVNDYDFTIVLNVKNRFRYMQIYKEFHAPLEKLANELASELDIKQVDLSPKPLNYFKKNQPLKIENYEIRQGHVLVYGKNDPTLTMPDWHPGDIPLFEGTWLFRNRGTGLLLAALYFIPGNKIPNTKKENFIIECTKAQLAMGDSVLLLKKKYHHLYNKRLSIIKTLDLSDIPRGNDIKRRYMESLRQKLNPDFDNYLIQDLISWWYDSVQSFEDFFKFYEQNRLKNNFKTWIEYADISKPESQPSLKAVAGKFLRTVKSGISVKRIRDIYQRSRPCFSISLVALVLFALHEDKFNIPMMEKAALLLNLKLTGKPESDWLYLARAVINEIHPGGEAGRVMKYR